MNDTLQMKLGALPDSPGCYIMKSQGDIIYVGKAINLKNRVRSYFQDSRNHGAKVQAMVRKIDDFDTILCDTNLEALILECNLIKLHKPYYNILLKDDKHYPYIRIDVNTPYPRLELVRRIEKDGAKYFGPYTGATSVRDVMEVVRKVFPLRTCTRQIRPDRPQRPCLHHQIGQCVAPCAGKVTPEAYGEIVRQVMDFLGGKYQNILRELTAKMEAAAAAYQFEQAATLRDQIRDIEALMERQKAISTSGGEMDILAVAQDGLDAMVQLLFMRGGRMLGSEHFALERAGDSPIGEVLLNFILQYYQDAAMLPRQLLVEAMPDEADTLEELLSALRGGKVALHSPRRGDKLELIQMAKKNAQDALEKRNMQLQSQKARTVDALQALADAIGLPQPPRRIEGYDISNTQGALSVASMVVSVDGLPAKKEYRHFRIKTVEGANDFASMNEVISRRFAHAKKEIEERQAAGLPLNEGRFSWLPDLILIDGGPQQLAFARRAMLKEGFDIPMFGLAKRLEEIFLPDREEPILLDRRSPALHLLQRLRDEAHRFAITHHRALRGKAAVHSQLEDIPGVGPKRRKALLNHFHTLDAIKKATVEQLSGVPGISADVARVIHAHYLAQRA